MARVGVLAFNPIITSATPSHSIPHHPLINTVIVLTAAISVIEVTRGYNRKNDPACMYSAPCSLSKIRSSPWSVAQTANEHLCGDASVMDVVAANLYSRPKLLFSSSPSLSSSLFPFRLHIPLTVLCSDGRHSCLAFCPSCHYNVFSVFLTSHTIPLFSFLFFCPVESFWYL